MSESPQASASPGDSCRRGPMFYIVIAAFQLFFLVGGGALVWMAFWVEHSPQRRLAALAMAAIVLLFPALLVFQSTRRKLTRGRWLPNSEDIAAQREKDFRRAQSPVVRQVMVTIQILTGALLAAVWGFTDVRYAHRHSVRPGWVLYVAGLQIFSFGTYWWACRRSLTLFDSKKRPS